MRIWITFLLILLLNAAYAEYLEKHKSLNTAINTNYLSTFEKEVVYEINLFRSNPAQYAIEYIAPLAKYYKQKILYYPNDRSIITYEGIAALNECIRELSKASPLSIMYPSKELSMAANLHCKDQGQTGETGHKGSNGKGMKERIETYGKWEKRISENIAYGNTSARQVIIFLLIDDNVKNRGHRKNLLNPDFNFVGVAFGHHPVYKTMCVMDFSGGISPKQ